MSLSDINNNKKLGIYISFKYSEKELYEKIKLVPNYSMIIKDLLRKYLETGQDIPQKQNEKSMCVTIDDLCKLISSVNPVYREQSVRELYNEIDMNKNNQCISVQEDLIPEVMLIGL